MGLSIDDARTAYFARRRRDGRSERVTDGYRRRLLDFQNFMDDRHPAATADMGVITTTMLNTYLDARYKEGEAKGTTAQRTIVLRSFFTFCNTEIEEIEWPKGNPAARLRIPKVPTKLHKLPTFEQVKAALNRLDFYVVRINEMAREQNVRPFGERWLDDPNRTTVHLRNKVIVWTGLMAGLREDEMGKLCWQDIQWDGDPMINVEHGKGDKRRKVPISDELLPIYQELFAHEKGIGRGQPTTRVLCSTRTGGKNAKPGAARLSNQTIYQVVTGLFAGLFPGYDTIAPHDLRRLCATHWYKNGRKINTIRVLLGHESIQTTQRYLGVDEEEMIAAVNNLPMGEILRKKESTRLDRRKAQEA